VPAAPRAQGASGASSAHSSAQRLRSAGSGDETAAGLLLTGEGFGFAVGERRGGHGGGDGDGEDGGADRAAEKRVSAAADASLDLDALADQIAPEGVDDGIFEVTMPDGQKMGVVVNLQGGEARFHLNPADRQLGEKLRRRQMELEGRLERRMHRKVQVTVL
jgi:hypothetical protein